jgi:hypothetical protein
VFSSGPYITVYRKFIAEEVRLKRCVEVYTALPPLAISVKVSAAS